MRKMSDVNYRGYTIKREKIGTATREYTEYEVTLKSGVTMYVERLWAAKYIVDSDVEAEGCNDARIMKDLSDDGIRVRAKGVLRVC